MRGVDGVGLLLGAKHEQEGLIDPLKSRQLGLLRWVSRVAGRLQCGDVGRALLSVRPDRAEGLQRTCIHRVVQVAGCALGGDLLLRLSGQTSVYARAGPLLGLRDVKA